MQTELKEDIETGNRIIAGFMGVQTVDNTCELCGMDVTKEWLCKGNDKGFIRSHALGGIIIPLKYHSLWDWLMPVVEKIGEMDIDMSEEKNAITGALLKIGASDNAILQLWLSVVQFIQYYNSLNK